MGAIPKERQLGLLANLPRMQAQQQISQGQFEATDDGGIYKLFMQAYGDEELARAEQLKALKALVRQETSIKR